MTSRHASCTRPRPGCCWLGTQRALTTPLVLTDVKQSGTMDTDLGSFASSPSAANRPGSVPRNLEETSRGRSSPPHCYRLADRSGSPAPASAPRPRPASRAAFHSRRGLANDSTANGITMINVPAMTLAFSLGPQFRQHNQLVVQGRQPGGPPSLRQRQVS